MLNLFTWTTPNERKVPILLAEFDLPLNLHVTYLMRGEQHEARYLAIDRTGKSPLVDPDGPDGKPVTIFESGAILMYVCDEGERRGASSTRTYPGRCAPWHSRRMAHSDSQEQAVAQT